MRCPYCHSLLTNDDIKKRKEILVPHCELEDEELAKWVAGKIKRTVSE